MEIAAGNDITPPLAEIAKVEQTLNLQYIETVDDFLVFEPTEKHPIRGRDTAIPVDVALAIIDAVNNGVERAKDYEGWIDPANGKVEFEVRQQGISALRGRNMDKFTFDLRPCPHNHQSDPPVHHDEEQNMIHPVIRVTSPDGSTCIEISPNSKISTPVFPLGSEARARVRFQSTLKVHLGGPTEKGELLRRSQSLANSFLFELNARQRAAYSLRPRMESPSHRRRGAAINYNIRFPKTPIPDDIAALFSVPSDFAMRGNKTLFYLSYYQILENYLPAVHKRETVRKLRRILRSLDFDEEKDASVLQILNSVERSHGASESDQLQTLIQECVPKASLEDFYNLDHGGHFTKNGPISGVTAINPKSGESLASQTAKRIYKLRNRIVHAKDDVRYAEAKVLLPVSHEALSLSPDIELLRMLAIEVIVDNR
ncbi:hypothetical protein [Streptomyces cyaneofuscatus]|uniref:hypothetical protein n=1 Tax=Streptomyces cyaneofuscatus TaxID=66883 RepID=UPI003816555C